MGGSANCSVTIPNKRGILPDVKDDINVYPNPVERYLMIEVDQVHECQLFTLNMNLVRSFVISPDDDHVDLLNVPSGIYLLQLNDQIYRIVKK